MVDRGVNVQHFYQGVVLFFIQNPDAELIHTLSEVGILLENKHQPKMLQTTVSVHLAESP